MTIRNAWDTSSACSRWSTRRTWNSGASDIRTPMNDAIGPKMSVAATRRTLAGALDAEDALGRGLEPCRSDRAAAAVALPIAALLELGERAFQLLFGDQQAVADADVVTPADRLVGA